jgi:AcrR family transcriptional regulator
MRERAGLHKGVEPVSVPMGMRLRAAERRAQLLGVARRLFARDGYRGASMESIAEAAGVTKPVLYQHFSSKRALYSALLANDLGRLTQELEASFSQAEDNEERLRRGFGAYFDFVDRHEDAFRLLFTEALGLDADFQRQVTEFRRWVAARVARIIAAEAGLAPPRARALAAAIVGMAEGAVGWWLDERRPLEPRELADELAGLAWKGFARFPAESREPDAPVDPSSLA